MRRWLLALVLPAVLGAGPSLPPVLRQVGFDQRLNGQVPLDLAFRDEAGRAVRLGDYFDTKPVILVLAYFKCPMLCTEVLNGLVRTMLDLPQPGLSVSLSMSTLAARQEVRELVHALGLPQRAAREAITAVA